MSAITAKASRKMKKYAVLTREPRCFLGSFDFSWEQRKLGDVVKEIIRNDPESEAPIMMITANNGFIEQSERYAFNNAGESLKKYILLKKGELAYNHGASKLRPYGSCFALTTAENARIPFVYHCFSAENQNAEFMSIELNGAEIENQLRKIVSSGARMDGLLNISFDEYTSVSVLLPGTEEQDRIADFFRHLDNLITLHQRKCANLCSPSKVVFSLLFATSTFSWEQRKLGEIGSVSMCRRIFKEQTSETGDIPFYKIGTFGAEPDAFISRELFEEYKSKYPYPKKGDILISASGSIGRTVEFAGNNEYFQDSNIVWLSHDERLSNSFLKCFYSVVKWAGIEGSTIKRLYNDNILNTVICMPSVPEQEHIGLFFENLDNLITLHQRECISFTGRADRLILTANKKRTTSSWEQRKLGELVDRVVRKNINNESTLPLTISAQYGLVDQITYFNNRVASRDVSNYYLVLNGEFAYNKSTSDGYPFGAVKRLDLYEKGVLSTLYIVFAPRKEQQIDSDYLTVFFDTDRWHKGVAERAAEGARNHGLLNISAEDFFDIDLSVPKDIVEQKQIGAFIRQLDHLITLHQRKPFLMKWRTSDANRNQTNRLVL